MAIYTYRCSIDGPVDIRRPIGTAPAAVPCPACGATSTRMITAPMLGLADGALYVVMVRRAGNGGPSTAVSEQQHAPA